jgi:hypothetical protein
MENPRLIQEQGASAVNCFFFPFISMALPQSLNAESYAYLHIHSLLQSLKAESYALSTYVFISSKYRFECFSILDVGLLAL